MPDKVQGKWVKPVGCSKYHFFGDEGQQACEGNLMIDERAVEGTEKDRDKFCEKCDLIFKKK
jgi:hypothetical protein